MSQRIAVVTRRLPLQEAKKRPLVRGANLPWFSLVRRAWCGELLGSVREFFARQTGGRGEARPSRHPLPLLHWGGLPIDPRCAYWLLVPVIGCPFGLGVED